MGIAAFSLCLAACGVQAMYLYGPADSKRKSTLPRSTFAFVLSLNDTRFERLSHSLAAAGINATRVWPVSVTEPALSIIGHFGGNDASLKRALSLRLSWLFAWRSVAHRAADLPDDSYFLMFEDDAALHESIDPSKVLDIAHEAAKASYHTGHFYLGSGCSPICTIDGPTPSVRAPAGTFSWGKHGVHYARCRGPLTHAYGLLKWRAEWYDDFLLAAAKSRSYWNHPEPYYHMGIDTVFNAVYETEVPPFLRPVLAGWDLTNHDEPMCGQPFKDFGTGVYYQAAATLPSQRLGLTEVAETPRGLKLDRKSVRYAVFHAPSEPQDFTGRLHSTGPSAWLLMGSARDLAVHLLDRIIHVAPVSITLQLRRIWGHLYGVGTAPWTDPSLYDTLAHTYTHRRAWQMIAVDTQLQDEDYVLVLEDGVALGAAEAEHERAAIHDLAQRSRRAGLFYLSTCGQDRQTTWQSTLGGVHRTASNCTRAYGIFKWRAAWLWDVLQAVLEDDPAFQSSIHNRVSVGAHLQHGLPKLLQPDELPLAPSTALL